MSLSLSDDYQIVCGEIVQYYTVSTTCSSFLASYNVSQQKLALCDHFCHPLLPAMVLAFLSIILLIMCKCCKSKEQPTEQPLPDKHSNNNSDNNNNNNSSNNNNDSNNSSNENREGDVNDQSINTAQDDRSYLSLLRSRAWLLAPYRTPSKGGPSVSPNRSQPSSASDHSNSNDSSPSGYGSPSDYDSDDIPPPQFDDSRPRSNKGSPSPKRHRRKWTHTIIQSPQEVVKEARIHRISSDESL